MSILSPVEQVLFRPSWWLPTVAGLAAAVQAHRVLGNSAKRDSARLWIAVSALTVTFTHMETTATRAALSQIEGMTCSGCWGLQGSFLLDVYAPPVYFVVVLLFAFSRRSITAARDSVALRWTFCWWVATSAVLWAYSTWGIFGTMI